MSIETLIKQQLEKHLDVYHLELVNESQKHEGHVGDDGSGQTHFKLMVVSDDFCECDRIQRQRKVYRILSEAFEQGLHAISIDSCSVEEFKGR